MSKLDLGQTHLLRLADKGADAEGWAKVSEALWPLLAGVPDELLERSDDGTAKRVRLTEAGRIVLEYA